MKPDLAADSVFDPITYSTVSKFHSDVIMIFIKMQTAGGRTNIERYPEAYLRYLIHFHATRDYFECHEELEQYWKDHPESPHRTAWVSLIQVAVAMYHERRGNNSGARKMLQSAVKLLSKSDLAALGIDSAQFAERLKERMKQLEAKPNAAYRDLDIPVTDPDLKDYVHTTDGYEPSAYIIHKHKQRDRSDVIGARNAELAKRNGLR